MGKNVGSNPRQRSRRPRHASSSLSQRRDFGVSSARRSMHGIGGRADGAPRRLGFLTIMTAHDVDCGEGRANKGQEAGN
jgi:hypothetical protein